jgi:hypothetical protein
MLGHLIRTFRRIGPWLERAEHADFVFGKLAWTWVAPMIGTFMALALAWWGSAPPYLRFLASIAALMLMLAVVDLVLSIRERLARRASITEVPEDADRILAVEDDGYRRSRTVALVMVSSVIMAAFLFILQTVNEKLFW